ncbi:MAG: hypothetical protein WBM61_13655 [Woeseiaceae bacterium]
MSLTDFSFQDFIRIWVRIALLLIFVEAYLTVNKIWIRKHEQVVSESVSVSAQLLALATGIPFIALYVMEGAYEGAIGDGVFLLVNLIMIMIGIGFWVEGRRKLGLWANLKKAMRLEKNEASVLLASFIKPVGARQVVQILHGLANIDSHLDERELGFIRSFADKWHIDLDEYLSTDEAKEANAGESFAELRILVRDYVRMSPPKDQASQLRDVLTSLVEIDGNVTHEEEIIMNELGGLIDDYVSGTKSASFAVLIAPQNSAQEVALCEILPINTKEQRLGGEVFKVGQYYSREYADMVCGWYRDTGYLTINERVE